MVHWKGLAGIAACAALACAGMVRADTEITPTDDGLTLRAAFLDATPDTATPSTGRPDTSPTSAPAAAAATPPTPLMYVLERVGVGKTLEDAGFKINGYVEGSYTYSASAPPRNVITGHVFDTKHERVVLDQADIAIDRTIDYGQAAKDHRFDIGGHFEAIYGWDTGIIHSLGLYDNPATLGANGSTYYKSRTAPENQFDIQQAYLDVAVPIGSGLRIRAGKFVTLLGQEVINPTGNALFSHSYLFGYAIPFTQTGIIGEYKFNDDMLVDAGITRGWNQSIKDSNGDPDFLGELTYTPQESDALKKWKFITNLSVGPEAAHDNHDWWTVIDFIATYTVNEKLTLTVNADYGDAPHGLPTSSAQWYGIAAYASYIVNSVVTVNARGEWYDDNNGFTLGVAGNLSVYEATLGLSIKPFPDNLIGQNLVIRPEVRIDYASKPFFDASTDRYQVTAGVDTYFIF